MPKTIQIRDVDDDVYKSLAKQAAEAGISVPELLKREACRMASRPSVLEWLERTRGKNTTITPADIQETLDELRGPWPGADS